MCGLTVRVSMSAHRPPGLGCLKQQHPLLNERATQLKNRVFSAAGAAAFILLATAACSGGGNTGLTSIPHVHPTTAPTTAPQALWVANGANVVEFAPAQFAATADPAPQAAINSAVFGAPQGVQFDPQGNLWVIDGGTVSAGGTVAPALFEFTPSQLASLKTVPNPMPAHTIRFANLVFPQQGVFDKNGNFWVTDNGANTVDVFTPAELTANAPNVTPSAVISAGFTGPLGIAFDSMGDLYVANNGTTTIFKFNAGTLPSSGTVSATPNVVLSDDGHGSIQGSWGLAFDKNGDLWSSNANAPFTLVEFTPGQLGASGMPVPAVTISPTNVNANTTLSAPNGIAFDAMGDLGAISSAAPFGAAIYGPQLLTASANVKPSFFLIGNQTTLNAPAGDVFGPAF